MLACWSAVCLPQACRATEPTGRKCVLAHYMPWYESAEFRGGWSGHWTGFDSAHDPGRTEADGLPDIWSHFHPLIGPYDSADPALIECHLAQMKLAGIDGVVVDWYGVAETADYPAIHRASCALFDAAAGFDMRVAACYEDRVVQLMLDRGTLSAGGAEARIHDDVAWLARHWVGKPQYLKIEGRPLLLTFGPIYATAPSTWSTAFAGISPKPLFFGLHHLWRKVGADGGFTWIHWDPWSGNTDPKVIEQRLRKVYALASEDPETLIVSAFPGFRAVYKNEPYPVLEHHAGRTLKQSLDTALKSKSPIVQLVTWNDYGEGTMIEPTHEFGYACLEIVQAARKEERGGVFPYSAADLRLPEQLYRARKVGKAPADDLDRIAAALRRGDCATAATALAALAP